MWIDGVLDPDRLAKLIAELGITKIEQFSSYVIAVFDRPPQKHGYRYLDPHRFIVQVNVSCTELSINFNPSPEEIAELRDFYRRLDLVKISNQKLLA